MGPDRRKVMRGLAADLDRPWSPYVGQWPQEWSGWVRTGRRIHLVFVLGQTVDSRPISDQI